MMKQKDAVIKFWQEGKAKGLEGEALAAHIATEVFHGLMAGDIAHKDPAMRTDEKAARRYAKSVTSNYLKRATEINGGVEYVPETRRGPQLKDEKLRELIAAHQSLVENKQPMDLVRRVEAAIAARKAEVGAAKPSSKTIPLSDALATLRSLGIPQMD